ncbi:MAG: hypothetical protein A3F68_12240 [Acidobacteria bacterium RIFCSPLOWO2_12_FULL_54_10]|nr:MAG: hypothetical protein A3F68_12240 [Acidobacteria bacterium RIFCSPLOWO2_12_FULL_54_10]
MAIYKRGKVYWYKFTWHNEPIRESTKQGNPRVARQMEAAHKTSLAKGEVGIRDRKPVPTLSRFAEGDYLPYVKATFLAKVKTRKYYEYGVKALLSYDPLATASLDAITTEHIAGYAAKRKEHGVSLSAINGELRVLRRMFTLAQEWGKAEKALTKVRMLPGERHRDRVLSATDEAKYLSKADTLLRDVTTMLFDCGLRPEECFRLRWENVKEGKIEVQHGKTPAARRNIQMTQRVEAILNIRQASADSEWVFPAHTGSGHIEPCSIKRQHQNACKKAKVKPFPLYTLRHTCLTRWAPHMDPWTLAYLAGHRDMSTTRRYVHPQEGTIRQALENARSGHKTGHSAEIGIEGETVRSATIN